MRLLSAFVKVTFCLPLVMLVGCSTMSVYTFQSPSEPRALVRTLDATDLTLCKNGERYALHSISSLANNDVYEVPAGEKITLIGFFHADGGNVTYTCYPRVAFKPADGERYIFDQVLMDGGCGAHVAREDSSFVLGVAPEFSQSRPENNCR